MLRWALIFLVVALIAAVLGFGGIAGSAAGIAKIIFGVFVILLIISEDYAWSTWISNVLLQIEEKTTEDLDGAVVSPIRCSRYFSGQ